jgi:tetratricopeptide (TPR) repeat protein
MDSSEVPELQSIWDEAKGHIQQGNCDKAIEIYKYVLIRYADNPVVVEYANGYLGDLFLTTQSLSLAEKHLSKAIAPGPVKARYYYLLGFTYSKRQVWGKAIRELKKALRLEPDNGEFERGLG